MNDAHIPMKTALTPQERKARLLLLLQNADELAIDGLLGFCKHHKLLTFKEPAAGTDRDST